MGSLDGSDELAGLDDDDDDSKGTPIGNIFGNILPFGNRKKDNDDADNTKDGKKKKKKNKYLDTFGENLTEKARQNKLDKVIGRDVELQRMIQILNRRSKNN